MISPKQCLLLATLAGPLAVGNSLKAAEEYQDFIPAELARLLLDFNNSGEFAVYSDVAPEFPDFQLPDGFSVAGSMAQSSTLRVALETELVEEAANTALTEAFINEQWTVMPVFDPVSRDNGFVVANDRRRPGNSIQLCHDQHGQVSASFAEREDSRFVLLTHYQRNPFASNARNCAERITEQERMMSMQSMRFNAGLSQYFPRMELPGTSSPQPALVANIGGMSGSNREMETDASIEIDWSLQDLFEHIAEQVNEQDWMLDSKSIGAVSATGTWILSVSGAGDYIGTLNIVAADENRFDLTFRVVAPGGSGRGSSVFGQ